MHKNKLIIVSSFVFVLLSISACSQPTPPTSQPTTEALFKVAMLIPETIDDGTWSQSGYKGLRLVEQELGAQIAYTERSSDRSEEELQEITRQYAQEGYDFIIGHGGQFDTLLETMAEAFPRTKFAIVSGSLTGNNKNLGVLASPNEELGYLAGSIAAIKTKSQKIAYIGALPYESLTREATLFEQAAQSIKPDIAVKIVWTGDWTLPKAEAHTLATELVEQGFDVWALHGAPGTNGMYEIAETHDVKVIEWNQDLYHLAPNIIITSMIIDLPKLILKGATLAQQGRWQGQRYELGFADDVIAVAPFRGALTPEQEQQAESIKTDIISGRIDPTR